MSLMMEIMTMSNLQKHAVQELKLLGYEFDDDDMPIQSDEDFDPNAEICMCIMEILEVFEKQGHSGFSAGYAVNVLKKLMAFEPLSPITGEDWEWMDIGEETGEPLWQNKRCSHVFKTGEVAYDINGKVFEDPDGCTYTGRNSRVFIEFPYIPKTEYVKVDHEGNEITE